MPTVSSNGKILYSLYDNASYKIAIIDSVIIIPDNKVGYNNSEFSYKEYDDKILGSVKSNAKEYSIDMTKISFMPKILWDYQTVKPGIYCSSMDLLNKVTLFGAYSKNSKKENRTCHLINKGKVCKLKLHRNFFYHK